MIVFLILLVVIRTSLELQVMSEAKRLCNISNGVVSSKSLGTTGLDVLVRKWKCCWENEIIGTQNCRPVSFQNCWVLSQWVITAERGCHQPEQ